MNRNVVNIWILPPTKQAQGWKSRINIPRQAVRDLDIPITGAWVSWEQHASSLTGTLTRSCGKTPPTPTSTKVFRGTADENRYVNVLSWFVKEHGMISTQDGGASAVIEWDEQTLRIEIELR